VPLTTAQREAIVAFETSLFTTQVFDHEAGELTARQAQGGPQRLSRQNFYFGINDVVSGDYRTGALFNSTVFNLYEAWNTVDRGGASHRGHEVRPVRFKGDTDANRNNKGRGRHTGLSRTEEAGGTREQMETQTMGGSGSGT